MGQKTYNIILKVMVLGLTVFLLSCCSEDTFIPEPGRHGTNPGNRLVGEESRNLLILYSAGYNSLSGYLHEDIEELKSGWLPGNKRNDNVLLVYTHQLSKGSDYSTATSPYLIRLYSDQEGNAVSDTLVTYPEGTISSSTLQLSNVLTYAKENFPAKGYSMIFSSHATGYLPAGFYSSPNNYYYSGPGMKSHRRLSIPSPVPYVEIEKDPSMPATRSIGQDQTGRNGSYLSYEMDIRDFAEALPFKMDYILFDACLMGGIEVAYELSGKCKILGFSQAEVLAEGLDYSSLTEHLLQTRTAYPQRVCEDYFMQYENQSGVYRSATISLIDCDRLEPLAEVCSEIFTSRRAGLESIQPKNVQRFYRSSHHWFYDLESIIMEAGADDEEKERLHSALDQCVIYKAHTPQFMNEFPINTFSGFSMYLPANGHKELDKYYKTLKWNIATGLVD